jgi:hypothetical protein
MIVVDTSVWIDWFNGKPTPECERLDSVLGRTRVVTGDLILAELLQGFRPGRTLDQAEKLLKSLDYRDLVGREVAQRLGRGTCARIQRFVGRERAVTGGGRRCVTHEQHPAVGDSHRRTSSRILVLGGSRRRRQCPGSRVVARRPAFQGAMLPVTCREDRRDGSGGRRALPMTVAGPPRIRTAFLGHRRLYAVAATLAAAELPTSRFPTTSAARHRAAPCSTVQGGTV